jgi:outer membrane biosynthesis protein TonB
MFIQHFGGLFMADETPEQRPAEELKKDTVRINLPPGLTGRSATPSITHPTPAPTNRPPGPPVSPEEEAKKETSVMGRPAEAPKPKKDTSRVQVTAAKPVAAESPRPTVKLQRDPAPAAAGIPAAAPAAARVTAGTSDGGGGALSLVAMVLSLAVAGYLAYLAFM